MGEKRVALRKIVMTGKPLPEADRMIRECCEVRCWDQAGIMPRELLFEWLADADKTGIVRANEKREWLATPASQSELD